jgi:translation initiation factor 4A
MSEFLSENPKPCVEENEEVDNENELIGEIAEEEIKRWDDLDIPMDLLRGIYAYGFETPSQIQKKAIKPILDGRDIIGNAESGTGKTATFSIGALSSINLEILSPQVIILSPTRELSIQSANIIKQLGAMMKGLRVQILVGGGSIDEDVSTLKNKSPHIIVGCPGRVYDMFKRKYIRPQHIKLMIIDEADEMLSECFKDQLYEIFRYLNTNIQVALFSATLPVHTFPIINKITRNPLKVIVKTEQLTLKGIKQYYVAVDNDEQKYLTIKDLYGFLELSQCIIYANSINRVNILYDALSNDGFPVCCIHSNMDKPTRDRVFLDFKNGATRILISSNVTARGIDIQQVSTVINFDIPNDVSTYLHRIGRSGRFGRKGKAINMITRRDVEKMKEIERYYSTEIVEMPSNFKEIE